ncbi:MAG: tRNA 5-methoxyuridine(34)/uridine 5-oxyacetic acid(34) synthase CmoB [Mariprofundus sp.]|nr:tRNA 5-methoxyuridine(34)/uridine 5-oxyacetic acid(34) synthase CmoB [Mariprofundus sp.]
MSRTDAIDQSLLDWLHHSSLAPHAEKLYKIMKEANQTAEKHGDYPRWQRALAQLPSEPFCSCTLNSSAIGIGHKNDHFDDKQHTQLNSALKSLLPWRKGPFNFFGTYIDSEWRSDWKWDRLKDGISPLQDRTVLDIGCGSGYHCWRMRGAGAKQVVGIDPTILFLMQFRAAQHYIQDDAVQFWPIGVDELPANMSCFDTVFSMGILYHRRSPIDHLLQLHQLLKQGGELVLETLIIQGDQQSCLMPSSRYAKMRNTWFLPSIDMLKIWLKRSGFKHIKILDVTATTPDEQRSTEWMQYESLSDYLDPNDPSLTIEGYPAPLRAVLTANK